MNTIHNRIAISIPISAVLLLVTFLTAQGCRSEADSSAPGLKEALTFYASFDEGFTADYADGDPTLYTVGSWDVDDMISEVTGEEGDVIRLEQGGRNGGALRFSSDWNPVIFFKGHKNIAYQKTSWAGTFSFWLRIDHENGLEEGYSDPFIVTDKNWDDASLYVDFTEDTPRHFRFAAFADKSIWNPAKVSWEDFPAADRPMIDIASLPFGSDQWTHVVLAFESFNSSTESGQVTGYLNGEQVGTFKSEKMDISWEEERVLMALGRHYAGDFDELAIFNRALTAAEVQSLYKSVLIDLLY